MEKVPRRVYTKEFKDEAAQWVVNGGVVVQRADEVFVKSQQAWLAFRNANCAYFDQVYAAVSTPGLEQVVCLLRMTRQRRHELNDERQFWVYKFRVPDLPPVEEAK